MKNKFACLMMLLFLCLLTSCSSRVQHTNPFYNYNDNDFPRDHLPIIDPVEATRKSPSSSWSMKLLNGLYIEMPKSQEQEVVKVYIYSRVAELEKFSVKDGVIMAYSDYVNQQADAYIQTNFYHWFVMIPDKNITEGFHTENAFNQYIESKGIQDPVWQTPDEAFDQFLNTGCLDWFPDCE